MPKSHPLLMEFMATGHGTTMATPWISEPGTQEPLLGHNYRVRREKNSPLDSEQHLAQPTTSTLRTITSTSNLIQTGDLKHRIGPKPLLDVSRLGMVRCGSAHPEEVQHEDANPA